jgi:hypothetical protein
MVPPRTPWKTFLESIDRQNRLTWLWWELTEEVRRGNIQS